MIKHALLTLVASLWALSAYGHHNASSHYVLSESATVEGVVTGFEMINPHARLHFEVTDESGGLQPWLAEGNSHGILVRRGWTGDELQPGEFIRVTGRPSRDGSNIILWSEIVKEDGTRLYGGNSIPTFGDVGIPEKRRQNFEDIRRRYVEERDRARQEESDP